MRDLAIRVLAVALREWWITNTVVWVGVIALAIWLCGGLS